MVAPLVLPATGNIKKIKNPSARKHGKKKTIPFLAVKRERESVDIFFFLLLTIM